MSFEIDDYNCYAKKMFFIRFYFPEKNFYSALSYQLIYNRYKKILENKINKNKYYKYRAETKKDIFIEIKLEEVDSVYFSVFFKGKNLYITLYKEKKEIKIKNINNEVKLYRVFTDKNILFLMEKEGLNSKNSILLTKEGIPTLHLEVAKVIKYNNDKEKNIFNLFFELSPDDKKILSLNFESYFECSNFKYEYTEERQKFYAILKKFIQTDNKEKNILFLMGKPGIGKSISLLNFLSKIQFKHCYFDFSKIMNIYDKSLLYNGCFKLFINDDFGIYKNLFEKIDSIKNIWDKFDFIFSNISILEKAIIVIDNYNSEFDEGFMNLKLLSNKFPNFKFIICLDESDKYSIEIFLDYFFPEKEKKI